MDWNTLLDVSERVLDHSHAAVLTTVDADGRPRGRWMVPCFLRGRRDALYAVTSPTFDKVGQIEANPRVTWLIQSKAVSEVVEITGTARVIDNPALKSDVLEALGSYLAAFWKVNAYETDLVVVETTIEELRYVKPMSGERASATAR